jgi:hypothetical protein
MRRLALVLVSLLALTLAAAAWARDSHDERKQLRPADMKLARAAIIRRTDMQSDWKPYKVSDNDSDTKCPGWDPDLSRFVVTGEAESGFRHPSGARLVFGVDVFSSTNHAVGDFRAGARPQFARCLRYVFEHEIDKPGDDVRIRVVSSRVLPAPRVGQRSFRAQVGAMVTGPARSVPMYMDFIVFQQDRRMAFVIGFSVAQPIRDTAAFTQAMYLRMQGRLG